MADEGPTDPGRRDFLSIGRKYAAAATGLAVAGGLGAFGTDGYNYLKGFIPGSSTQPIKSQCGDLLFAEAPGETAILPPGTNRMALAQGKLMPSRYLQKAFDVATATHKKVLGLAHDCENDADSYYVARPQT